MKCLITGGAGYIGSHVSHLLAGKGYDVVVLDNLYSGNKAALPAAAEFVEGDVNDRALLESLLLKHHFTAVLHFAAHIESVNRLKTRRNTIAITRLPR